jgi:hypothetical protein
MRSIHYTRQCLDRPPRRRGLLQSFLVLFMVCPCFFPLLPLAADAAERYPRLDDGSLRDHARLKKSWERAWNEGDGASTVLPYDGGIHSIGNPGEETSISVHLYGPRMSTIDGRDYDPSRDYVCDRRED